jgi:hypothetical protein
VPYVPSGSNRNKEEEEKTANTIHKSVKSGDSINELVYFVNQTSRASSQYGY